jgi:hypothetical protein
MVRRCTGCTFPRKYRPANSGQLGMESNWLPTGEDFFLIFRLYGPEKALFEKTWTLADVEIAKQ